MAEVMVKTPMQYLDKATATLRDLGLMPTKVEDAPINALLQKISDLDEDRVAVIARTLGQTSVFNEVVSEQTQAMEIGERYRQIAEGFNSIRDDAKTMVDQIADAKIDGIRSGIRIVRMARRGLAPRSWAASSYSPPMASSLDRTITST